MRYVLVFDKDRAFVSFLQRALCAYGFEVQVEDPNSNNIHTINSLNPEAIFIAVDAPDMVGYALYNKARKAVVEKIPIILTTVTLSPQDLALHAQLKLDTDIYLDKRSLSRSELLHKLDELIGLGPPTGSLPPEEGDALPQPRNFKQIPVGEDESSLLEEPPPEAREAIDADDSKSEANREVSGKIDVIGNQTIEKDEIPKNDLRHRLAEQESEIFLLRKQLEEARHNASSSPFSNYFLKLQEQIAKLKEEQKKSESNIARLQAAFRDAKNQRLVQLRAAEEKHKTDLHKVKKNYQYVLSDLNVKFNALLAHIQSWREAKGEAFKQKATKDTDLLIKKK